MTRLRLSVFLLVLSSSPAALAATDPPEPGAAYRVARVAAGDVLNVRVQPDPGAPVTATLAPGAAGVLATGTWTEFHDTVWWRVILPGGAAGWVNADFLDADGDAGPPGEPGLPLACVGAEPFWSATVEATGIAFEDASAETTARWRTDLATGVAGRRGHVLVRLADDEGRAGFLAASRAWDGCSDGMSEFMYPYSAILLAPDGTGFEGCCGSAR